MVSSEEIVEDGRAAVLSSEEIVEDGRAAVLVTEVVSGRREAIHDWELAFHSRVSVD